MRRGRGGHDGEPAPGACQVAQDIALEPIVDGNDVEARRLLASIAFAPAPLRFVPAIALAGGDILGEVEPDHAGPRCRLALQRLDLEFAVWIVRDHRVRHAVLADERGQRARVDAGDGDDAVRLEPHVEVLAGAPVGRRCDRGAQHAAAHAACREARRFHVLVVGADIADMREGEGDDLSGIRRIGEDLLIAGHRRVEADLADRDAGRARAPSFDDGAVGQDEEGGRRLVGPIGQRAHARRCGLLGQSVGAIVHGSWVAVAGGRLLGRVRVTQHQELRGTGPAGHADSYVRSARRSIHSGKYFPVKTMD